MNVQTTSKTSTKFKLYNWYWPKTMHPLAVEMKCIERGGKWKRKDGEEAGAGLFHHYRRGQEILWPEKAWHKWNTMALEAFCEYTYIGEMGCSAAGKSDTAASDVLFDWYCFPHCTTVLVSSTDLPSLDVRVWGMVKRYHRLAKEQFSWIPGHLIESFRRIIFDPKTERFDGRDFRNGLIAVPTKRGGSFVGLQSLVGIHNKRVHMIGDELNLMPRSFIDSISNLSKCEHFRFIGIGNPNDTTNAHGFICEPATEIGGWESGIDQTPKTKTWPTRMPKGICIQYPGSDSPNLDVPEDEPPPFPFLMTRQQMKDDAHIWGVDDWHYQMMNEARMPRGQGSRRVITRQMCEKFGALLEPKWRDTQLTKIAFLDAAYGGVGGDRCVFGELDFGAEAESDPLLYISPQGVGVGRPGAGARRQIMALVDLMIIPVSGDRTADTPQDQIAQFVMNQCRNRGIEPENFYYDSGMRTALVTAFSRLWSPQVNSIDCGGKPSQAFVSADIQVPAEKYYSKFITELWYSVRLCIECRQFRSMNQEAMWEFAAREFKLVSGNRIELETKEEMKKKTGRSPDLADAIAIGVHGAKQRGFIISKLGTQQNAGRKVSNWKQEIRDKAKKLWHSKQLTYK